MRLCPCTCSYTEAMSLTSELKHPLKMSWDVFSSILSKLILGSFGSCESILMVNSELFVLLWSLSLASSCPSAWSLRSWGKEAKERECVIEKKSQKKNTVWLQETGWKMQLRFLNYYFVTSLFNSVDFMRNHCLLFSYAVWYSVTAGRKYAYSMSQLYTHPLAYFPSHSMSFEQVQILEGCHWRPLFLY